MAENFEFSIYTKILLFLDYWVTGFSFYLIWSGKLILGSAFFLATFPLFRQAMKCLKADTIKHMSQIQEKDHDSPAS